jgi:hypothetical protein
VEPGKKESVIMDAMNGYGKRVNVEIVTRAYYYQTWHLCDGYSPEVLKTFLETHGIPEDGLLTDGKGRRWAELVADGDPKEFPPSVEIVDGVDCGGGGPRTSSGEEAPLTLLFPAAQPWHTGNSNTSPKGPEPSYEERGSGKGLLVDLVIEEATKHLETWHLLTEKYTPEKLALDRHDYGDEPPDVLTDDEGAILAEFVDEDRRDEPLYVEIDEVGPRENEE